MNYSENPSYPVTSILTGVLKSPPSRNRMYRMISLPPLSLVGLSSIVTVESVAEMNVGLGGY